MMTEYQKGAALARAMLEPTGSAYTTNLLLLRAIPITPDPDEAWLQSVPPEQRISRERAAEILQRAELLWDAMDHCNDDRLVAVVLQRQAAVAAADSAFNADVQEILHHAPTTLELQEVFAKHEARLEEKLKRDETMRPIYFEIMRDRMLAERANESGIARTMREWRNQPGYAQKEAERRAAEERERVSYDRYRALIEHEERKLRGGKW